MHPIHDVLTHRTTVFCFSKGQIVTVTHLIFWTWKNINLLWGGRNKTLKWLAGYTFYCNLKCTIKLQGKQQFYWDFKFLFHGRLSSKSLLSWVGIHQAKYHRYIDSCGGFVQLGGLFLGFPWYFTLGSRLVCGCNSGGPNNLCENELGTFALV